MVLGEVSEAPYALFVGREAVDGCAKWRAGVREGELEGGRTTNTRRSSRWC